MDHSVVRASFGGDPEHRGRALAEAARGGRLRFGPFELSPATGELLRDGRPLKLQQQPFRVLVLLARNAGRLLTRDEIQRHVWGEDTFVDFERGLNYSIMQIRAALGDNPQQPRFVETLPRRGYRFVAAIGPVPEGGGDQLPCVDTRAPSTSVKKRHALVVAGGLAALLGAGSAVLTGNRWPGLQEERAVVAVLPFADLGVDGDDGDDSHFGDGLTEDVIAELGRVRPGRLGVIARQSVMRYRGSSADVSQVGRELGAGYVLEGSVRRDAERVRITARLVRVRDRVQVWARRYDEPLRDILGVQSRIAQATALGIGGALPGPSLRSAPARSVDPEAYRHYMLGRHFAARRSEAGLRRARASLEEAVRLDPGYAAAWVGLADVFLLLGDYLILPPTEAFPRSRQMAHTALSLDPDNAAAHASLANLAELYDWDFPAALRGHERALALNPSHAEARKWYAELLAVTGRTTEAVRHARLALELDPLSVPVNRTLAGLLAMDGQIDAALEQSRRAIELDPDIALGHLDRGMLLYSLSRQDEALLELRRALELEPRSPFCMTELGQVAARAGRGEEVEELLARLQAVSQERPFVWRELAALLVATGRRAEAVRHLERALEEREPVMRLLPGDPAFAELEGDPGFERLKRRVESQIRL